MQDVQYRDKVVTQQAVVQDPVVTTQPVVVKVHFFTV
jgi:hypothetical protein